MSREFKLTFGKYKGETLEEIYIEDREYLDWLKTLEKPGLTEAIEACEKEMRNVRICE